MPKLDLHNLDALTKLDTALGQFADEAIESLHLVEVEVQRVHQWIDKHERDWYLKVENAKQEVAQALVSLAKCQERAVRDSRGGSHTPDCGQERYILSQAKLELRMYQEKLQVVRNCRLRLNAGFVEYRKQTRRLSELSIGHNQKSRAYLKRAIRGYESVIAAATMVGIGGALGMNSIATGISFIRQGINRVIARSNQLMGDAAEGIAQQVAAEEMGLRVVDFDQRKKGFDGILQGPNGQYILLESKSSDDGLLHLSPDSYGYRQTSADWVAHVAKLMTTPGSELYSATNAEIGQAILATGSANVPMLAVVTNKQTNKVNIFLRTGIEARSSDWLLLSSDSAAQLAQ